MTNPAYLIIGVHVRDADLAGAVLKMLGRVAILHHNFPELMAADPAFQPIELPVPRSHLLAEGVSESFVSCLGGMGRFGITSA